MGRVGLDREEDLRKDRQGLVDVLRLLQPVALGAGLCDALGAREVDEVEDAVALEARVLVLHADLEREDHVRAGGLGVGQGRAGGAGREGDLHQGPDVGRASNRRDGQAVDDGLALLVADVEQVA